MLEMLGPSRGAKHAEEKFRSCYLVGVEETYVYSFVRNANNRPERGRQ